MLAYLEEAPLFSQINQNELFFQQTSDIGKDSASQSHHIFLPSMSCPSDPAGIGETLGLIDDHYGARGNYAANAGWSDPGPGFEDCGIWMNEPDWQMIGNNGTVMRLAKTVWHIQVVHDLSVLHWQVTVRFFRIACSS